MLTLTGRLRLPLLILAGVLLLLGLRNYLPELRGTASMLYAWANTSTMLLGEPINNLRLGLGIPAVGAFLLGLLAATAPCQLSTNAAAVALFSGDAARGSSWRRVALFLAGKTLVYLMLAGVAVWIFGGSFSAPGALLTGVRSVLGLLMILLGIAMLGWLRLPSVGIAPDLQHWYRARGGALGDFILGSAFGLAFCPTLFWLFFGLMLPTAIASSTGVLFPAFFALGTAVPLLLMLALIGWVGQKREIIGGMRRFNRVLAVVAGAVLVLAGLYDTVVYWFV